MRSVPATVCAWVLLVTTLFPMMMTVSAPSEAVAAIIMRMSQNGSL